MNQRNLFYTILFVFCLVSASYAQMTISSGDLATSGSYHYEKTGGPVTFSSGSAGANQTWNFSAYTWGGANVETYVSPTSTPHSAAFPTATRCKYSTGFQEDGVYEYERVSANGDFYLGSATADSASPLSTESQFAPLPYTYPNTWTILIRMEGSFQGFPTLTVDSIIQSCDGWGTVTTPFGSQSCLRLFHHTWISTYLNGQPLFSQQSVGYSWVNQQGVDVVTVSSEADVTDPNFTSGTISMLESVTSAEPSNAPVAVGFSLGQNYPNPFNPTTTLPISLEKNGQVSIDIYNETGRLVSSQSIDLPAGNHELPIDGSEWSSGTYFARVASGSHSQTTKMTLMK